MKPSIRKSARQPQPGRTTKAANTLQLRMETEDSAGRRLLEGLIAERFDQAYGARIEHFLPCLVSLDCDGQPAAIAGLRPAGISPLFLEQYLDREIEQAVSAAFHVPVDRSQVVEIGNLVSIRGGAASTLFALLPAILHAAGIRWVTCTATPAVRTLLSALGFPARTICMADPGALEQGGTGWGSYYAARPAVIAGSVGTALRRTRAIEPLAGLCRDQARDLAGIVSRLQAVRA